jgi:hypothetical protein
MLSWYTRSSVRLGFGKLMVVLHFSLVLVIFGVRLSIVLFFFSCPIVFLFSYEVINLFFAALCRAPI